MANKNLDVISRKALLAEYDRVHIGEPGKARKLIADAPTVDAVEVVRCKDCEYRHDSCFAGKGNIYCDYHHKYFGLDDFCSYGERKDNERKAD